MTIKDILTYAKKELELKKIKTALLDAEVLLSFVLKKPKEWIYINNNSQLTTDNLHKYKELIEGRKKFEPVAYLVNNKEFYGLDFYINKNVLIPRPETEILVEQALQEIPKLKCQMSNQIPACAEASAGRQNPNVKITIVDIGTGSGNIAVALVKQLEQLKHLEHFELLATDISEKALEVARKNAKKHKVSKKIKFLKGSFLNPIKEKVDIIISNPPYVPKKDKVSKEVKYEPRKSVFLPNENFQEKLIRQINKKLKSGGFAFLEIGGNQKKKIEKIVKKIMPKVKIEFVKDYSGIYRAAKIYK